MNILFAISYYCLTISNFSIIISNLHRGRFDPTAYQQRKDEISRDRFRRSASRSNSSSRGKDRYNDGDTIGQRSSNRWRLRIFSYCCNLTSWILSFKVLKANFFSHFKFVMWMWMMMCGRATHMICEWWETLFNWIFIGMLPSPILILLLYQFPVLGVRAI